MNISRMLHSLRDALKGVAYALRYEQNFRLQIYIAILVIIAMSVFGTSTAEKIVLFMLSMLVVILELVNTVIEKLIDLFKPRLHMQAAIIKDVMAAAVLIASVGAAIIGVIIFYPYVVELLWAR